MAECHLRLFVARRYASVEQCMLCHGHVSFRLSVLPSITSRCFTKTAKCTRIMITVTHSSPGTPVVFWCQRSLRSSIAIAIRRTFMRFRRVSTDTIFWHFTSSISNSRASYFVLCCMKGCGMAWHCQWSSTSKQTVSFVCQLLRDCYWPLWERIFCGKPWLSGCREGSWQCWCGWTLFALCRVWWEWRAVNEPAAGVWWMLADCSSGLLGCIYMKQMWIFTAHFAALVQYMLWPYIVPSDCYNL